MSQIRLFTLFVSGTDLKSEEALASLTQMCAEHFPVGTYRIEIVDVLKAPVHGGAFDLDEPVVVPTIVLETSLVRRKVVGNLSSADEVARALGISAAPRSIGASGRSA